MQQETNLSSKILDRVKKIYQLPKAKDMIKWYDSLKLSWFEKQIHKTKQKRNKRFEKEIMQRTAITWNKLKNYNDKINSNNIKQVLIKRKDGRWFLVDENDPIFNEKG